MIPKKPDIEDAEDDNVSATHGTMLIWDDEDISEDDPKSDQRKDKK